MTRPKAFIQFYIDAEVATAMTEAALAAQMPYPDYMRQVFARAVGFDPASVVGRGVVPRRLPANPPRRPVAAFSPPGDTQVA